MAFLYYQIKPFIFEDEQIKALCVSSTTAALINADALEKIQKEEDVKTQSFKKIEEELKKALQANRRTNVYINFLYTIRPDPEHPGQFLAIVDPEPDPEKVSAFGIVDENIFSNQLLEHLNQHYSPPHFISDQWGTWLSGFSPVYDAEGRYVATVRADITIDRYLDHLFHLQMLIFYSLGLALVCSILIATWMAKIVTSSLRVLMTSVHEIGKGNLEYKTSLKSGDEFEELAKELNKMTHGLLEKEHLKTNFARYVSHQVLEKILNLETPMQLKGERRKITVLFSDTQQFIELAKKMAPEKVISLLNEYFSEMFDIIFLYEGTLDKFMADALMVEFGAPLDDHLQEIHAVSSAIAMQKAFKRLALKWQQEGYPLFEMGIGIHTGEAVVGNIGSEKHLSYTAIGDTVNVAARLQQVTKDLKTPILISESTYQGSKQKISATSLGPMTLHGREEPVSVYAVGINQEICT